MYHLHQMQSKSCSQGALNAIPICLELCEMNAVLNMVLLITLRNKHLALTK